MKIRFYGKKSKAIQGINFSFMFFSLRAQRKERKERAPGEKPLSVFTSRFQEFQNSRARRHAQTAEIFSLKTLAHTGLFNGIKK